MVASRTASRRELLPELARLPGHLVWRAHGRVTSAVAEVLPPGVDLNAYAVLLALAGGVTRSQQELADTVSISRTTMVHVAADLAAQGLVERVRNPADRRSYALTRTRAGATAVRRWRPHAEAVETLVATGFSAVEHDELRSLLQQVIGEDLAPDVPPALRHDTAFLIARTHFRMHRDLLTALEPLDFEPRHVGALTALTATGPVPQNELARLLGTSAASVVQIADHLEHRGLVERRRAAGDRRTQELHLLPAAAEVLSAVGAIAAATVRHRFAVLSIPQARRLVTLLQRFVTAP